MTNILLIDLSSLAHPLWHVSASEPDPNATSTKTVERVRALASGQPHVAICCDSGRSFRKDIDATYKAQRPESDAALQHQITLAIETLRGDGFPVWAVKGYEADDLLATATSYALTFGGSGEVPVAYGVTIASSDKDLLQLINARVKVKSLTNGHEYDEDAVVFKFGVRPDQIRDYLALVGDSSDNIKGATGIGPKKAAELLKKYGKLETIFMALTKNGTAFTPALATTLREFEPRMKTVRDLITLRTDAPIPFEEIFKERTPIDVAIFGEDDEIMNDLREAMQPLPAHSPAPSTPPSIAIAGAPLSAGDANPSAPNGRDSGNSQTASAIFTALPIEGATSRPPSVNTPEQDAINANLKARREQETEQRAATVREPDVLAPAPAEFERQLEPRSMAQAKQLAADLFASRLFSAYGNAPAVLSTILAGRELGLQAMASLRAFHIIEGKPSLAADLIRALVLKSGAVEYFRPTERTAEKATFVIKRKGDPEVSLTYTIDEARTAWPKRNADGSVEMKSWMASGWGKNPADMCVARASSKIARLVCPDVTHGLYASEEMES